MTKGETSNLLPSSPIHPSEGGLALVGYGMKDTVAIPSKTILGRVMTRGRKKVLTAKLLFFTFLPLLGQKKTFFDIFTFLRLF